MWNEDCGKQVCIGDAYMKCLSCELHFHLSCTDVNELVFETMKKHDSLDNFIWCCVSCMPKARKTIGSLEILELQVADMEKKFNERLEKN